MKLGLQHAHWNGEANIPARTPSGRHVTRDRGRGEEKAITLLRDSLRIEVSLGSFHTALRRLQSDPLPLPAQLFQSRQQFLNLIAASGMLMADSVERCCWKRSRQGAKASACDV